MSGTPKRSSYELDEELQRLLDEARRSEEERLSKARAEARERQRQNRLSDSRKQARERSSDVASRLTELERGDLRAFLDPSALLTLRNRLESLDSRVAAGSTPEAVREIEKQIGEVDRDLASARSDAQKRHFETRKSESRTALADFDAMLGEQDEARSGRFDAEGFRRIRACLDEARQLQNGERFEECVGVLGDGVRHLEEHRTRVAAGHERLRVRIAETADTLAGTSENLAGLGEDDVVARWCADRLARTRQEVDELTASLEESTYPEGDRLDEIRSRAGALRADGDAILDHARSQEDLDGKRRAAAEVLVEALKSLGFSPGSPTLRNADDPDSPLVIQATSHKKESVETRIDLQSAVEYEVGGRFHRKEKRGKDGKTIKACDSAAVMLKNLRIALEDRGVKAERATWDNQGPILDATTAVQTQEQQVRSHEKGS